MMWGFWANQGVPGAPGSLMDISENDDLIVLWGIEPIFHNMYGGLDEARVWKYWKDLGKEVVVIEPLNNETSLVYADSWIPVYPGTDGALACAIAHTWITEGLYDQEYLDTHTIGFDEEHMPKGVPAGQSFKSYIMGEGPDKVEKTPEWAEEHCGVPARVTRKLAREWGSKPTSFWVLCGGAGRREYADTWSRLMVTLSAMQGFGKPGSNMVGSFISLSGPYDGVNQVGPIGYSEGGMNAVCQSFPMGMFGTNDQHLTFEKLYDFFEAGEGHYYGGDVMNMDASEYFNERDYPAEGCSEVHFLWQRGSTMTNPPERNRHIKFLRHPKLETFIVSAPWFDRDCRYADLVLPTCTCYERNDLTEPSSVGTYVPGAVIGLRTAVYHQQCIEPVGESMTDLDICAEVARRLGFGEAYLEGNTEDTFLQKLFDKTNIPISYEEMKDVGYYVWPVPEKENWEERQFKSFYEDPDGNPLATPTGKIEIFSTIVWEHYGYNEKIPPVPHYIPENEGYESEEQKKRFPLQQNMAHPKFRFHGKYNDCTWLADAYKVKGDDGYSYEPVLINPADAEARGIEDEDIVRAFNDRGQVLVGAVVTHRVPAGVVQLTYGSWNDPLEGEVGALDRGGDGSVLSNGGEMSPHHLSGAYNSNLVEMEKADLRNHSEGASEGMERRVSLLGERTGKCLGRQSLSIPARCLQCSNCWVACKDEHCSNDWSPITAPQGPDEWWIKVKQWEEGSGRHMKMFREQILCQHCDECALVKAAPDAVYKREDGIVIIDPEAAKGMRNLVDLCPYGTVYWNEELGLAQKCTLCAHLLDAGWDKPRCVNACPADALQFVDVDELTAQNMPAPAEKLHPEYGTNPSLVYMNAPTPFIAGECASARSF